MIFILLIQYFLDMAIVSLVFARALLGRDLDKISHDPDNVCSPLYL